MKQFLSNSRLPIENQPTYCIRHAASSHKVEEGLEYIEEAEALCTEWNALECSTQFNGDWEKFVEDQDSGYIVEKEDGAGV